MDQQPWTSLRYVDTWAFDLDHTLYSFDESPFPEIHDRILSYMQSELDIGRKEAEALIPRYHDLYGLTMYGLMRAHAIHPEPFLWHVHDVSLECIRPNQVLAETIQALPGKKVIFTNGCADYAKRVCKQIGLEHVFSYIFDIRDASYQPKPHALAYAYFLKLQGVRPEQVLFMDDLAVNAAGAKRAGMLSAWVAPNAVASDDVTFYAKDLYTFLQDVHAILRMKRR
jgi:putative hydrolase of the HAD superfamily